MKPVNERALSVALLQSEREVLHTPGLDLSAFLASDSRWDVQLFTDRNFEGLAETAAQFDSLVLGFNVVYLTETLRKMLEARPPRTGLVILHQLRAEALAFLPEDLRVGVVEASEKSDRVLTPAGRDAEKEILLNWPEPVCVDDFEGTAGLAGSAICYFDHSRPGRWRTVFEIEHDGKRLPVVIRTPRSVEPGIVICNLWLEPSRASHGALLANMIRYAALGFPEVAVLGERDGDGMDLLARKIRLQGTKVVQVRPDGDGEDPFSEWPLRDVSRVVVRCERPVPETWRQRGGTLIRVGETDELTVTGGAPDKAWIAGRWATWFSATDPETWHGGIGGEPKGSIFQSRGVLRMLSWMNDPGADVGHLGCPPPERYARELGMMIGLRLDDDGSIEGTISATAAALDVHRLTNDTALTAASAAGLDSWLASVFASGTDTSLADLLDIARCRRSREHLEQVVRDLRRRVQDEGNPPPGTRRTEEGGIALAPMIASALRHACVAICSPGPGIDELLRDFVEDDVAGLSSNMLLAADYLYAAATFTTKFPQAPCGLGSSETSTRNLEQAISAVGKYGHLVRLGDDPERWRGQMNGEVVGTEALALIEYLGMQPANGDPEAGIRNTHTIAFEDRGLPAIAVNQLIREVQSTRKDLTEAREELRSLPTARHIFGALVVLLSAITGILGISANGLDLAGLAWLGGSAVVLGGLWLITKKLGLAPRWLEHPGEAALSVLPANWQGVVGAFRKEKGEDSKDG